MKSCPYCGKRLADDVTICPIDGQPVLNQEDRQGRAVTQLRTSRTSFNVKLISPIVSVSTYRIFVERSDLLFIQVEGSSKSVLNAVAPLLGPLGGLAPLTLWLFTKKKTKAKLQRLEEGNPEELVRESEKNFRLHLAEIRDAAIEVSGFLATSRRGGRLNFVVRHGEKIRCEFPNATEMSAAVRLLVPVLNSTLKVNVEWNAEKQRFEKRKRI